MTKLPNALLLTAAAAPDGAIDAPSDRRSFAVLIKKGLMSCLHGDARRLVITEAGRSVLAGTAPAPSVNLVATTGEDAPAAQRVAKGKIAMLTNLLRREEGASIDAMMAATGWQAHSVRGAISGALKKTLGLAVTSEKADGVRTYRIVEASRP